MDRIALPDDEVVALNEIAPGVHGLRIIFVNVFGVLHADGTWSLIDAGLPFSAARIRHWAERQFGSAPRAIVLTHGHFDHVSAAGELASAWKIPVYAHALEFPYLTGQQEYPAPEPSAAGAMAVLSPLYPRGPVNLGPTLHEFTGASMAAVLPGWRAIETPGHTPGHLSFYRESDRLLLAGDAFCTTKPESFFKAAATQTPEMHGPPSYFTSDWAQARASVKKLAQLRPLTVAPGHGQPVSGGEVAPALDRLASRFDQVALPSGHRGGGHAA